MRLLVRLNMGYDKLSAAVPTLYDHFDRWVVHSVRKVTDVGLLGHIKILCIRT